MALLIGQAITGRHLEQWTSEWPPDRFASLCDALAWAASGRACPKLPSFTARVNAKDKGIDAEWDIVLPDDGHALPTPILGPGWNVFQYKKRDLIADGRRAVISNLKSSLKGAVKDLTERNGRHPDRYVLFVNADLNHDGKPPIKKAILDGYANSSMVHVEIVGAAELAVLLNDNPHLRAAYFTRESFKTWQEAYQAHQSQKHNGADVELTGREGELNRLKLLVDDPRVRVVVLTGPHDVGKSRLALEATRHRPHYVVQALDPRSMALNDYRQLVSDKGEILCIVEDPDSESIDLLVSEALTLPTLKLIITLPTSANAPAPSYGRDERVQSVHLQPLSEENARKLLRAAGRPLDFSIEDWIIRNAGGVPGVLLVAASVGNKLRDTSEDFAEQVGQEFEDRIKKELGPDALHGAQLFSLLTHVGISGAFENELNVICELFGEGWDRHNVLLKLPELEKAGLAKRGGSFVAITIPMLANSLVSKLLQGRQQVMLALFGRLDEPGRIRLLKRLSGVTGDEVARFWKEFSTHSGPLENFQAALKNAKLLTLVAGTVPDYTVRLLESGLLNSNRETRLGIADNERRELVRTLEQLIFRASTSRRSVRLLWLLAEAENETYANNATGVLIECFHPSHPQMPLPLGERIELLNEFISDKASKEGKLVVVKAVAAAWVDKWFRARQSTGSEPLDWKPDFTYNDFYDYACNLVDILMCLANQSDEVAKAALDKLPWLTAQLGIRAGQDQEALELFKKLVEWARSDKAGLDIASLLRALRLMREHLSKQLEQGAVTLPSDLQNRFRQCITGLQQLEDSLGQAGFAIRLKRWAGNDMSGGILADDHPRFAHELKALACDVVKEPSLLTADLVAWLVSPSAQKSSTFFFFLGSADKELSYQNRIEEFGAQPEPESVRAFAAYWQGWAQRDREAAEARLDELTDSGAPFGAAIVQATAWLGVGPTTVTRVKTLIQNKQVTPKYVADTLEFRADMADQLEQLLKVIAGEYFEYAAVAVRQLAFWVQGGHALKGSLAEFAWCCLEHELPVASSTSGRHFDQLAAGLAQDDTERGFKFLEKLIQQSEISEKQWNPLDPYDTHKFWEILYRNNRGRLIELVLNVAQTDTSLFFDLKGLLDQESDGNLLLDFARKGEESARAVANGLTGAKPGFWPLAFKLVEMYPNDEILRRRLTAGIEQEETIIEGPMSRFYEGRKREIERVLQDPATPPRARDWLREVMNRLEGEVSRQIVWDYDEDVNDLRRYIQDKNSDQRIWAIGRILKYAAWKDAKRWLTVEDIEEALPQVDLPEKKRKMLEAALEVWRHAV
ncbi:MAG: hypothetical protein HYR55_02205 [Acidobacteria bacterium]|nr:hypothetical protein [Acidobacteriota bacterium]MBI3655396.1 hypothetical protein [Acidobacteriota bacterium]